MEEGGLTIAIVQCVNRRMKDDRNRHAYIEKKLAMGKLRASSLLSRLIKVR